MINGNILFKKNFRLKKIQEKKKKNKKAAEDLKAKRKAAGEEKEMDEAPNILNEGMDQDLLFTD